MNAKTLYRRRGILGTITNTVKGKLSHEAGRKKGLVTAIMNNNEVEAVRLIKETGMTPQDIEVDYSFTKEGSPLIMASARGQINVVRALLDAGANKDASSSNGITALHRAKNAEVVRALLDAGANKDSLTSYGNTPLHNASVRGNVDTARALIDAGANKDAVNGEGKTPLHHASYGGYYEIVRALLDAGANKDALTSDGNLNALHLASQAIYGKKENYGKIVRALLDAGVNKDAVTSNGDTPLHFAAATSGNAEIVRMLIDAGANKNAVAKDGLTPFRVALRLRTFNVNMARMLQTGELDSELNNSRPDMTGGKRKRTMRKRTMRKRTMRKRKLQ